MKKKILIGVVVIFVVLAMFLEWQLDVGSECTVVPSRTLERNIYAKSPGILVNFNYRPGDRVSKGDVLGSLKNLELNKEYESVKAALEDELGKLKTLESQMDEQNAQVDYSRIAGIVKGQEFSKYASWAGTLQKGKYPNAIRSVKEELDRAHRMMNKLVFEEENISKYNLYPKDIENLYFRTQEAEVIFKNADSNFNRNAKLIVNGAISQKEFEESKAQFQSAQSQLDQRKADFEKSLKDHSLQTLQSIDEYEEIKSKLGASKEDTFFTRDQKSLETQLANAEMKTKLLSKQTITVEHQNTLKKVDSLKNRIKFLEEDISYLTIKSPLDGIIITPDLNEKLGKYFTIGEEIAGVASLEKVQVNIEVNEKDISEVKVSNKARLKVRPYPSLTFYGDVKKISPAKLSDEQHPSVQPKNFYLVELVIDNKNNLLKPGMTGFAKINCGNRKIYYLVWREVAKLFRAEYWLL